MSATRLLLFTAFLFGLFHIYLFVSQDPGLQNPRIAAEVAQDVGFTAIAAGLRHTCAIGAGGGVWCWGAGEAGQLGHGRFSDSRTPVPVSGLPDRATAIAVGGSTSCAALHSGGLWCWGSSASGQIGLPLDTPATAHPQRIRHIGPVRHVALGHNHACALGVEGTLWCWGEHQVVRDNATYLEQYTAPRPVEAPALATITAGDTHSCATDADQRLWCWGAGMRDLFGTGEGRGRRTQATPVLMPASDPVRAVALGSGMTCTLQPSDAVACWGGDAGLLPALGTHNGEQPRPVLEAPGARALAAGNDAVCALDAQGRVACAGAGEPAGWRPFPEHVPDLDVMSAKGGRLCGLDRTGSAWCVALSPNQGPLDTQGWRPANWQADNTISARWNRAVGWWAATGIAARP